MMVLIVLLDRPLEVDPLPGQPPTRKAVSLCSVRLGNALQSRSAMQRSYSRSRATDVLPVTFLGGGKPGQVTGQHAHRRRQS